MYYFDEHKLYQPQALKYAYRKLSLKSRAARSAIFPVHLSNWIIAILFGVHGAAFNLYFYNFIQEGDQLFSLPVLGVYASALQSFLGDNMVKTLGFGLIYVGLIPLLIGLILRSVLFVLVFLLIPRVSPANKDTLENLDQMSKFCLQAQTSCDYSRFHLILPSLIIILGAAAGIMYISYLQEPSMANGSFWDLFFSCVLMIPLSILMFLPHGVIYSLELRFFRPLNRKVPASLWQAITAEKQRLTANLDVDTYYTFLRQKMEQAAQEAREVWSPALTKRERRRSKSYYPSQYRTLDAAKWNQSVQPGGMDSASLEALQAAQAEK